MEIGKRHGASGPETKDLGAAQEAAWASAYMHHFPLLPCPMGWCRGTKMNALCMQWVYLRNTKLDESSVVSSTVSILSLFQKEALPHSWSLVAANTTLRNGQITCGLALPFLAYPRCVGAHEEFPPWSSFSQNPEPWPSSIMDDIHHIWSFPRLNSFQKLPMP